MLKRFFPVIIAASIILASFPGMALAGFGISPPYVKSDSLLPGSKYEQKITLLRSSAEEDLQANITIDAPEIQDWLSIDKGLSFDLPKDELQVPMTVTVTPPSNAELGNYTGHINIRVAPKTSSMTNGVAIALGARVDIELALTNKETPDFKVRAVNIPSIEMLGSPWDWPILRWFFYRLKVAIKFENTGNVKTAPTKVALDVYDLTEKNLLESLTDKSLEKVDPFTTKDIYADFPITLDKGQYWGKVKIYKGNEVVNSYKIAFTVAARGTLPEGRINLGFWPWILLGVAALFGIFLLFLFFKFRIWYYLFRFTLGALLWLFNQMSGLIEKLLKEVNRRFWTWMKDKASKYDDK